MSLFVLDVDVLPVPGQRAISLRLTDEHGRHLGASQVRLDDHPADLWEGLFELRGYVQRSAGVLQLKGGEGENGPATAEEIVRHLGVFLGEKVLGPAITRVIAAGAQQRTLLIRLPNVPGDPLVASLSRVPWEIARLSPEAGDSAREDKPLLRRNVVVRAVPSGTPPSAGHMAVPLGPEEMLRVLLVYAHAPGSRPLAARLERERLLAIFFNEIMPERRVAVDVLCHGVTRERLRERVQSAGGYHIVHWSGHGRHDALELAGPGAEGREGSKRDTLRGADVVEIFVSAGGFIPQLVYLSACHSGSIVATATATASEGQGYTGTALELLRAGVPQVIAMRYEVTDAYARELSALFYRSLLAQQKLHAADAALAMARAELWEGKGASAPGVGAVVDPVDHATPLLFGADPVRFEPAQRRSPELDRARPRPQPLLRGMSRELDPPEGFVGREAELARLASVRKTQDGSAVALIHGPAGIGKTAMAAEAIHLWHRRFDWVLAFQTKPQPLSIEELYQQIDDRLFVASPSYRARRSSNELSAVSIEPRPELSAQDREGLLRDNLVEAMRAERILLVLDSFETNLADVAGGDGAPCVDPAWDKLLEALAERLRGGGSRVLITSRRRLKVLEGARGGIAMALGPLPALEAALFLDACEPLRSLMNGPGGDPGLARRVIEASRGHPLTLKRLGELAGQGRAALVDALDRLSASGAGELPDLRELKGSAGR
jgi:hypothetical protein